MSKTIAEDLERIKDERILIADENGKLRMKKDWTGPERVRISLNKWWVFISIIIGVSQIVQAVFTILNYFK